MTLRYYRIPRCLLLYHSGAGTFSWVLVVHISISICVCVCVCVCVCIKPPESKSLLIGEDPDTGKN